MLRLVNCIGLEHNLYLVGLAAIICFAGAFVTARLFQRSAANRGRAGIAWMFLGAIGAGATIWCTHFVAMLAFKPGTPVTYDPALTVFSLVVAFLGCGVAFGVGREAGKYAAGIGGALFGVAVTAMHYTGMAAFAVNGTIDWHQGYVAASVAAGVVLGAVAFHRVRRASSTKGVIQGAILISLGIVLLHFLGMSAMSINAFAAGPGDYVIDSPVNLIALSVAGVGLLVLGTGVASYVLDDQVKMQSAERLRHLTESAVDGMAVLQDGRMLQVNSALEDLTGLEREALLATSLGDLLNKDVEVREGELIRVDLRRADGSLVPVELVSHTQHDSADAKPLTVVALRDISQRLEQEQKISFLAQYDSLTSLRNRASFIEKVNGIFEWDEKGSKFAVLALDLDRFKETNDTYGHAAGDQVLRVIGERMRSVLGKSEIAGRFGGDEFAVFAKIERREEALALAERIKQAIEKEIPFEKNVLSCGASIGISLYPADGGEINELLNNADLAMYRAKSSSRDECCFYDKQMDDNVRERRRMTEELRHAIMNDQLELHYQVQIDLDGEKISGYEALVRWNHPEKGLVPPGEFIGLAEQTGLIVKLGEWVLKHACEEAAGWPEAYNISVNLSPAQLTDPGFVEMLRDTLWTSGLESMRLELEVTETCFIKDPLRAVEVLGQIKDMGVSISIDDFGTGYSSLAMLQDFPFDKIKLDKSLIDKIDTNDKSKGIFKAVMSLGDALAVPVLAEGVETGKQLEYLRSIGCQLVQGYYYGRPEKFVSQPSTRADRRKQVA